MPLALKNLVTLLLLHLSSPVQGQQEIPPTLLEFYNSVTSKKSCKHVLASGFYSSEEGSHDFSYCGDHLEDFSIVYITGKGKSVLTNMDVDCDGAFNATTDDNRCGSSTDTQGVTSFQDDIQAYNLGLTDLDANVHPYVVFGNRGSKKGYSQYDPQDDGVEPLSLMAVVCNNKLVYGVWGDYNGDDGSKSLVGEASISLATLCYGDSITGGNGHDQDDVLYIAFVGTDAVPGAQGANWTSGKPSLFERSLTGLGDKLVERITGSAPGVWTHSTIYTAAFAAMVAVLFSSFV